MTTIEVIQMNLNYITSKKWCKKIKTYSHRLNHIGCLMYNGKITIVLHVDFLHLRFEDITMWTCVLHLV